MGGDNNKMEINEIEWRDDLHNDCGGIGFTWNCPECNQMVTWAPNSWWSLECGCSSWDVDIIITGEKNGDI